MDRKVSIVEDLEGMKTVFIHDIIFKGRQKIDWDDVEKYMERYVGDFYNIDDSNDVVYIGSDMPDEYAHSQYTAVLKGTRAKAKANAAQGIPELVKIATEKTGTKNKKEKHNKDAKYGWYKYASRFALPVYGRALEIVRYNVFDVSLIVRHDKDERLYLYDIVNIKKEAGTPFQPNDLTR